MKQVIFILTFALGFMQLFGFEPNGEILFNISRSKDANRIFYLVNLDEKGLLDTKAPITIYWVKPAEDSTTAPLTWIQNKYAYGLNYVSKSPTEAEFQFVSYKKRNFYLRKDAGDNFRVYTFAGGKEVELDNIFIQIDGGSFWFPTISRVELHARKADCRTEIAEIINP